MQTHTKTIYIDNEPFHFEEVHLEHGRKRIDREIARENLELFYPIIEASGVSYGLFFGTLLGAVREGNFIAHDEDTDIYVFEEEKEAVTRLLPKFREVGLETIRFEPYMISMMRKDEYIDLYFFKQIKHIGGKPLRKNYYSWEFDAEPMENPERFEFLGMSFPVPANPEHMLEVIYGKNWRTPIKDYNAPKNTVLGKLSCIKGLFTWLPFYDYIEKKIKNLGMR
jgi:lipopolysaccharide cholinephosphotransferase